MGSSVAAAFPRPQRRCSVAFRAASDASVLPLRHCRTGLGRGLRWRAAFKACLSPMASWVPPRLSPLPVRRGMIVDGFAPRLSGTVLVAGARGRGCLLSPTHAGGLCELSQCGGYRAVACWVHCGLLSKPMVEVLLIVSRTAHPATSGPSRQQLASTTWQTTTAQRRSALTLSCGSAATSRRVWIGLCASGV